MVIVHMLLMSWGGEIAKETDTPDLKGEVQKSEEELYQHGVLHNDVRPPNIVWNKERDRAMLIDFDRAEIIAKPLKETSGNRQRKKTWF
jgi:hypothetical protein